GCGEPPTLRLDVVQVAWAETNGWMLLPPFSEQTKGVAPSKNCTLPVAVFGVTVAVKVTGTPLPDGFCEDTRVVVLAGFTTTVNIRCTELTPPLSVSPLSWTVTVMWAVPD